MSCLISHRSHLRGTIIFICSFDLTAGARERGTERYLVIISIIISLHCFLMMAEEFIYRKEPNKVVPPGATRVIAHESVNIIPAQALQSNLIIEQFCHDGVKTVETGAFNGYRSLRRVIMPGVKVVERHAFARCDIMAGMAGWLGKRAAWASRVDGSIQLVSCMI